MPVLRLLLALLALSAVAASPGPPNIVVFLADDLGFSDLGSYGSEIATPNIDRLAESGLRFANFHTASSCAPSRAMLLTGVDSHRAGVPNITEAIPSEQRASPYYRGSLREDVATLAERLREAGYRTSITGKWHLGHAPGELPFDRGFERSFALGATGADNWQDKTYLPIYEKANWFADGQPTGLPQDFYSSRFLVDKTLEFLEAGREDARPFFAYVPFQAVHIPVQAPRAFTEKYLGIYDDGWSALREARLARARQLGVVPPGTRPRRVSTTPDWSALSDEERRYRSKAMAVYAGMIEAMDFHIGRLVDHLVATGEYENTLFVFMSDNGSEASDPLSSGAPLGNWLFAQWLHSAGYDTEYETLGERGSYNVIGPGWASAAAAPLYLYKFFASEGGTRVPLIISGPGVRRRGETSRAFTWVTDVFATLAEAAGADAGSGRFEDRPVAIPTGRSLRPLLSGSAERIYGAHETVGFELGGNAALFKGDHKLVLNRPPVGDGQWHLYDIAADPGETTDLAAKQAERLAELKSDYAAYAEANHVLPVPADYDQRRQVMLNGIRHRLAPLVPPGIAALVAIAALAVWWRTRRSASL